MNLYTVHYRHEAENSLTGMAEDVVLVKDGFNWLALFMPTVWFLAKKMWIIFTIYLVIQAAIIALVFWTDMPSEILTIMKLTGNVILGFEGNDMHRWHLERQRYRQRVTVAARDMIAAEHRFFSYITSGRAFSRRAGEVGFAESTS